MIDYTNRTVGSLMYRGPATIEELAEYKPRLVKRVTCIGGKRLYVRTGFDHHKYWFYHCSCGKTGIVRTGRINYFRCECQKNVKKSRKSRAKKIQSKEKICLACKKMLPLTTDYFYKAKTGYFSSYCKLCLKGRVSDSAFRQII